MRRARWLAPWRNSLEKPVLYHCISRVVDRRFVLGPQEKEKFRALMRVYERFSGCRVTAYCLMDNHFHLLLEVPPQHPEGLSDEDLLQRLSAIYPKASVADVAKELANARQKVADGWANQEIVEKIHARYTYRMHNLGEFMKGLLQRYTQWHNRIHSRSGRLWEDRFKSLIVEDGPAARAMAAYIDLNPVRAGVVEEPAEYRWSSYGEAVGGGCRSNGRTARAGLVRAWGAHKGMPADPALWSKGVAQSYRQLLMGGVAERSEERITVDGKSEKKVLRKGMDPQRARQLEEAAAKLAGNASNGDRDSGGQESRHQDNGEAFIRQTMCGLPFATALRCRVRYFTDGAVIGSRGFVDEVFARCRDRFGPSRTSGARKLRGDASPMAGIVWSLRDLKKGIG